MKFFLIAFFMMMFSFPSFSQSKSEISAMLKQFKSNGMISDSDYKKAVDELNNMKKKDIDAIKEQAHKKMNDPKVQEMLQKMKK